MSDYNLLIDGKMVPGDQTMPVLNPATEEVLAQCPRASKDQLDKAVAAASRWRTPPAKWWAWLPSSAISARWNCRCAWSRAPDAGARIADALESGADLLIVNRFGKRERDGKGLGFLIERALDADIPVVIAVSAKSFADWIRFAGGMSVKLACDRAALEAWWRNVALRNNAALAPGHITVCEALK
jgi:uncharacterized protein DUF2478/aldehyde dehydrogenase family protein